MTVKKEYLNVVQQTIKLRERLFIQAKFIVSVLQAHRVQGGLINGGSYKGQKKNPQTPLNPHRIVASI